MFYSIRLFVLMGCISLLITLAAFAQNAAPELNITLGEQRVRFAPTRGFQEMQLEVVNSVGEVVLTHTTTEGEYDWNLRASNGEALAAGLYNYRLALKFSEDLTRQHRGHFIVEEGQGRIWLTAQDGAEISGAALNATRSGGRSIAGLQRAEDKSVKRDVSGRELVDEKGNKLAEAKDGKKAKQEKAALLGTQNKVAKFDATGAPANVTDSAITEVGGNVGINTTAPTGALEIYTNAVNPVQVQMDGVNAALTMQLDNYGLSGGPTSGSGFLGRAANGTKAAPADVASGNRLGFNVFGGWAGGAFRHVAAINAHVGTGTISASSLPSYLNFMTTPNGSVSRVERMRIDQYGNVGIGTTSPGAKLDVAGIAQIYASSGSSVLRMRNRTSADGSQLVFYDDADEYRGYIGYLGSTFAQLSRANQVEFGSNGAAISLQPNNVEAMRLTTSGWVGIGTANPGFRLHVVGTVHGSSSGGDGVSGESSSNYGVYGSSGSKAGVRGESISGNGVDGDSNNGNGVKGQSGTGYGVFGNSLTNYAGYFSGSVYSTVGYFGPSDQRYKQSVQPLAQSLNKLAQLRGVSYEWKRSEFPQMNFAEGRHHGLLAQEVEKVFPEMVKQDSEGMYSVAYLSLIPVLVEAIKEQDQKAAAAIAIKDKQLASQAQLLAALQTRLATVERVIVRKARKRK